MLKIQTFLPSHFFNNHLTLMSKILLQTLPTLFFSLSLSRLNASLSCKKYEVFSSMKYVVTCIHSYSDVGLCSTPCCVYTVNYGRMQSTRSGKSFCPFLHAQSLLKRLTPSQIEVNAVHCAPRQLRIKISMQDVGVNI